MHLVGTLVLAMIKKSTVKRHNIMDSGHTPASS